MKAMRNAAVTLMAMAAGWIQAEAPAMRDYGFIPQAELERRFSEVEEFWQMNVKPDEFKAADGRTMVLSQ